MDIFEFIALIILIAVLLLVVGLYYVLPTLVEIGQGKLSVKEFEMPDLSLQPQTAVSE
jgi:hypothetical protein